MSSPLATLKENWRIALLVVLVLAAGYFIFVPGAPVTGAAAASGGSQGDLAVDLPSANNTSAAPTDQGMTNLQFGIELGGGARITTPVNGLMAEDVPVSGDSAEQTRQNADEIQQAVASAMPNASESDVVVYTEDDRHSDTNNLVEVRVDGSPEAFASGLQNAGYDITSSEISRGVADPTIDEIIEVLDQRLGEAGFSGGTVTQTRGNELIIEAPGRDIQELEALIREQGLVETVIHYPADNEQGYTRESLLTQQDFEDIDNVQTDRGEPSVPATLTDEAASEYTDRMISSGFTQDSIETGGATCEAGDEPTAESGYCIMTVVDGETIWTGSLASGLAESIEDGTFEENPQYRMTATSSGEAQTLRLNLIAGALPAELALDRATEFYFSPTLAENFKTYSLITGIIAILAVVGMIFLRYGDPSVAVPMSVTGLSEVVILLGFAAAVGLPLDLSHVAGFIVVVGTGVDDLIIIADE
ncbi:MAG: preprotein translocase subunit SecD, partial [Salinarchaeum sp.]